MTDTAENKVTLKVEGMTCSHCVGRVQKALDAAPGVIEAKVDLDSGTAQIRFGVGTEAASLAEVVTEAGYPAQAA
ncbi:MAG: heavy-metal-associated domain-containing protein [Alphaproteobacteria bacterium]|nr:heavy-metal-associated domain-containing protein [Alphaproteobacteria bacterium]MCK5622337.1 heavy-metal-associated domain-containing protein [Alphaproteobacteria bacterium]